MIEPNGSMCGIGFSVSRPARLAVSSPNHSATTPWLISCRMTATTSATKQMTVTLIDRDHGGRSAALGCARDAQPRGRHRFEPGLADRSPAGLAHAVVAARRTWRGRRRCPSASRAACRRAPRPRPVRRSPGPSPRSPRRTSPRSTPELDELVVDAIALGHEMGAQRGVRRLGHGAIVPLASGLGPARPGPSRQRRVRAGRAGARVGGFVDGPEPLRRDLGVHLRGRDRRVAEQLLHDAQVGTVVEHVGRARVPQDVR